MRIISGTLHATPLPWLPVLSHILPNLRRQEATAKLLTTIQLNDKLPCVYSDINSRPSVRLLSRHPVWLDKPAPDATAASEWIDAWFNATVVNQSLVTDSTICPSGFNLHRRLRSTLNRFRTGQSRCAANLVRWHPSCICGNPRQTVDRVVNHCPITRFSGGLWLLHQADEDAVSWLSMRSKR